MRNTARKVSLSAGKLSARKPFPFAGHERSECFERVLQIFQSVRLRLIPLLAQAADCLQDRCELEEAAENEAFSRVMQQTLSGLAYVGRRIRESSDSARCRLIALACTTGSGLLTHGMREWLHSDSALFLLGGVVVSAAAGGLRAGLLTTLLTSPVCAWFLLHPAQAAVVPPTLANASPPLLLFGLVALFTCALTDSLYAARQQAEAALGHAENMARRSRFLAEASVMPDASQHPAGLLGQITRASVPAFADWATVDRLDADSVLERVAATHPDLEKEKLLWSLRQRFPIDLHAEHPLANALRTGRGELIAEVSEAHLQALTNGEEQEEQGGQGLQHEQKEQNKQQEQKAWQSRQDYLAVSRFLAPRSLIFMPLAARGRVLGVLTLASASSERRYTAADMAVARDLAMRAGLALDNLRLHQEAQQEIAGRVRMEQQLREANAALQTKQWELEEAIERLAVQVNTDGLTGLNNHRAFQEALQKELGRTRRYRAPLSLLLLDIDHFRQYNDAYGHPAGDRVLRQAAAAVQDEARATDFVARYGGEEFAVILPDTDEAGALQMGERLRRAVEGLSGLDRAVTASFGAATLTSEVTSASELISRADKALYASKHNGRNRVTHARTLPGFTQAVAVVRETPAAPVK